MSNPLRVSNWVMRRGGGDRWNEEREEEERQGENEIATGEVRRR